MLTGKLLEEPNSAFPANPQIPLDFTNNFELHKHNSLFQLVTSARATKSMTLLQLLARRFSLFELKLLSFSQAMVVPGSIPGND